MGLGLGSPAFCTFSKPQDPKKFHSQPLDPRAPDGKPSSSNHNHMERRSLRSKHDSVGPRGATRGWEPVPTLPCPVPSSLRPQSRMLRPRAHRSAVKGSLKCLPPPFLLQVFNSGLAHINSLNRCIKHTHTHTDRCTPPQQGVKTHTEKPHKT